VQDRARRRRPPDWDVDKPHAPPHLLAPTAGPWLLAVNSDVPCAGGEISGEPLHETLESAVAAGNAARAEDADGLGHRGRSERRYKRGMIGDRLRLGKSSTKAVALVASAAALLYTGQPF